MILHCIVFVLLFSSAVPVKGLSETLAQQDVAVQVGEEACLQCPLRYTRDVLQVMWQKILPEEEVTVATCHSFRHKLNPDFSGKIGLKETGLQKCSIVVRNVTKQDEGCYLCLFITSSDVAHTGKACLQMYELHEPILNVTESNSTGEIVVSCSATGRPAPKVNLYIQHKSLIHNNTVAHSNGTVTVITTAVLSPLNRNKTQECRCSVSSPFGSDSERQVFKTIPEFDTVHFEFNKSGPNTTDYRLIMALCIALFCGCVIAVAVLVFKKQQTSRDVEENKNVNKEVMPDHGRTPLKPSVNQENETLRKRTPPTEQEGSKSKLLTLPLLQAPRKLFNDKGNIKG